MCVYIYMCIYLHMYTHTENRYGQGYSQGQSQIQIQFNILWHLLIPTPTSNYLTLRHLHGTLLWPSAMEFSTF